MGKFIKKQHKKASYIYSNKYFSNLEDENLKLLQIDNCSANQKINIPPNGYDDPAGPSTTTLGGGASD